MEVAKGDSVEVENWRDGSRGFGGGREMRRCLRFFVCFPNNFENWRDSRDVEADTNKVGNQICSF